MGQTLDLDYNSSGSGQVLENSQSAYPPNGSRAMPFLTPRSTWVGWNLDLTAGTAAAKIEGV